MERFSHKIAIAPTASRETHVMLRPAAAGLMALFTLVVLAQLVFKKGPIGYDLWAGIFAAQWMKVLTLVLFVALGWHAWVGMRDIWMDYVKPVSIRLTLQAATILWLIGCAG